mmetsp:Transcript_5399/g.14913  ORF Transcript_5399/g.14913 Transcript_5399/m.14913 type:complete len:255 (-) Transcript_5399:2031-2795(-)
MMLLWVGMHHLLLWRLQLLLLVVVVLAHGGRDVRGREQLVVFVVAIVAHHVCVLGGFLPLSSCHCCTCGVLLLLLSRHLGIVIIRFASVAQIQPRCRCLPHSHLGIVLPRLLLDAHLHSSCGGGSSSSISTSWGCQGRVVVALFAPLLLPLILTFLCLLLLGLILLLRLIASFAPQPSYLRRQQGPTFPSRPRRDLLLLQLTSFESLLAIDGRLLDGRCCCCSSSSGRQAVFRRSRGETQTTSAAAAADHVLDG